jgi:hypothetical protein
MTEIIKSNWYSDGDSLKLSMPIAKVDKERRLVSGFATLDNIDQHGDIVAADASTKAFENFRGNIREMHTPLAVGKMVSFRKETFFDKNSGKEHSGIFVDVYVSKGAQDTWEKVLDGTLSGFSIGGNVKKTDNEFNSELDKSIRVIKEYDLTELSLVDNPANQLSNIFSIQKTADGNTFSGIAADVQVENIFYDASSDEVFLSKDSEFKSPTTDRVLENIGWVETSDTNKSNEINRILDAHKQSRGVLPETVEKSEQNNSNTEGGVTVADTTITQDEVTTEAVALVEEVTEAELTKSADAEEAPAAPAEDSTPAETPEAPVEEASAPVAEVEVEETDFAKMFDDMKAFFSAEITKTATAEAVSNLTSQVDAKIAEVTTKYNELAEVVNNIKAHISSVEKRVDGVESETAIKKSSDLDGSDVKITKTNNKWGGHFLSVRDIY